MKKHVDIDLDFDRDSDIDEQALDVEWLEQTRLAVKYAKNSAYWNDKVRRLEERKKIIRSQIIIRANKSPSKTLGKDKPTASDFEAYYRSQPEYIEAVDALNDAMEEAEYAEIAKNEICYTKKKALENLVILHGQQYFAGPSVPRDLSQERIVSERHKSANARIRIGSRREQEPEEREPEEKEPTPPPEDITKGGFTRTRK